MSMFRLDQILMAAAIAAMIVFAMVSTSEESLNLISLILIWGLFAIGFDLIFGMAGMLSFGHAAMFGAGGYALALLAPQFGFLPSLLVAAVAGAALAFLLSVFALRVSGLFFSLLTLALAQLVYILASTKLRAFTGGLDGIPGVLRPALFGVDFYNNRNYFYFLVAVFVIGLAIMALLRVSPFGSALKAVQANDVRAEQIGYNVQRLRQCAFMISGAYAGVSGALLAPTTSIAPFMGQQFVAPAFITVVVGGATNVITGALGSSLILSLVRTPVGFVFGAFLGLVALLLAALIIIRLMPDGISAWLQRRLDQRHRVA